MRNQISVMAINQRFVGCEESIIDTDVVPYLKALALKPSKGCQWQFCMCKKIGSSELNNEIIQPHGIDIDANINIYTTGVYLGTKDFDPGSGIYNLPANEVGFNEYLLKLDAWGNFVSQTA